MLVLILLPVFIIATVYLFYVYTMKCVTLSKANKCRKYEFTGDIKEFEGRTMRRIRALRDFGDVKAGELGGWIEAENNLAQDGTAWVGGEARVYGEAWVFSGAQVGGEARVSGEAWVYGEARVYDGAQVSGEARVFGKALVFDKALVCGKAWVYGESRVSGEAQVYDEALVSGKALVGGEALVFGEAWVGGEASATRSPITYRLPRHSVTATDNHIQIGCQVHTYEHWLAHYEEIGRAAKYATVDIELYGAIIKDLARIANSSSQVD